MARTDSLKTIAGTIDIPIATNEFKRQRSSRLDWKQLAHQGYFFTGLRRH